MLRDFKTRPFASNQIRTEEHAKKFNLDVTLKSLVPRSDPVIFDVGGYNGDSIVYFKNLFPDASITSFEPNPLVLDALHAVASRHENVRVVNRAVSNKNGVVEYFQQGINPGLGGLHKRSLSSHDSIDLQRLAQQGEAERNAYLSEVNKAELHVPAITLADYVAENPVSGSISILKLDTQGHEPEILEGCGDLLKRIDVVLTECCFYDMYERQVSFFDLEKTLLPFGFRLWDISHISKNPMNGRTDWVDVIYTKAPARTS
jgi:FkbM family methyltransferase